MASLSGYVGPNDFIPSSDQSIINFHLIVISMFRKVKNASARNTDCVTIDLSESSGGILRGTSGPLRGMSNGNFLSGRIPRRCGRREQTASLLRLLRQSIAGGPRRKKETYKLICRFNNSIYIIKKGVNGYYKQGILKENEKLITITLQFIKRIHFANPVS